MVKRVSALSQVLKETAKPEQQKDNTAISQNDIAALPQNDTTVKRQRCKATTNQENGRAR